jgi:hypothetical protein
MRVHRKGFGAKGQADLGPFLNPRPSSLTHCLTLNLPAGLAVLTRRCRAPPTPTCDGHGHFALSASVEDILERRRQHHVSLDIEARKKAKRTMSPDRDYGFSNLNVQEQGEKPSPGLRQAAKSAPQNIESSSSEA